MACKIDITRKWEVFPGRNRFYCNGRLMSAPSSSVFLITVFLITGTSTLFFIYDCTYLADNVTIAIPIIGGLLFLFTMSALLRTSLTDPGIIPRATSDEAAYVEKQIEVTNSANSPTYRPPPRTKEVIVKGQPVKLKYCFTCKLFRPPRASHCSLCDNCVDRFDHHCPWVGNCVGRRNYRFFYIFIISLAFLTVFIFSCAIAHLILISKEVGQFLTAVKESPASMVVVVVCFISVWSILGLSGYHTYLVTSDRTTNEDIKGSFPSRRGQDSFNPYSHGNVCLNCFHVLCDPLGPSLIDRRGVLTDEYKAEMAAAALANKQQNAYKLYPMPITNVPQLSPDVPPGIYRHTADNTESNVGSVTHLVNNEQPLAVVSPLAATPRAVAATTEDLTTSSQSASQQCLSSLSGVYSNLHVDIIATPNKNEGMKKAYSLSNDLNTNSSDDKKKTMIDIDDLHLDPIEVPHSHHLMFPNNFTDKRKLESNDLTVQDRENLMLSANRLKILRDTTMIESALDLDSLDDSSIGTSSQAGLMKVIV